MENLYNLNIEKSVLSSIIFEPSNFEELATKLNPDDFYFPFHRNVFEAMVELDREEVPIDEEFLRKKLIQKGKFDDGLMSEILATNPLSVIEAYLNEIKDKSLKRELLKLTTSIKETLEIDLPSAEALDQIQQKLYKISQNSTSKDFKDSPTIIEATIKHILEMKKKGNVEVTGLNTGFRELNKITTGFNNGDLIIIAARPAMGKTAFCLNIAQKVLDDKKGVAFFSLEMPSEQLALRLLSAKSNIPLQNIKLGNLSDEEWGNIAKVSNTISEQKLFVDDSGNVNIHQIRTKLRKLKSKNPEISLAIIDYLQLMNAANPKERHLEVSEISRGLKLLARELEIPIVALSQLNRSLESRNDKRPMLSDLRESGAIEQDADMILFVYRDDVYKIREEKEKEKKNKLEGKEYAPVFVDKPNEEAEIIIGKNRNGPVGVANLIFHKAFAKFVDKGAYEVVYEDKVDIPNTKISMPGF